MPPSCCAPSAPTRNATAVEAVTTTRPGSTDGMVQLAGGEFLMGATRGPAAAAVSSTSTASSGVRPTMEFAYDEGGLAKGGDVTLSVGGDKVGEGRVEHTVPMLCSGDETTDVGGDSAIAMARQ